MPATTTTPNTISAILTDTNLNDAERAFEIRRQFGWTYARIATTLGYATPAVARNAVERVLRRRVDVQPNEVGFASRPVRRAVRRGAVGSNANTGAFTFGVEIEFHGADWQRARTILDNAGVDVDMAGRNYTHQTIAQWKVVYDGSVSSGAEAVSPPLVRDALVEQSTRVVQALRAQNCSVSRATGLHLHVGAGHLTGDQLADVFDAWNAIQHLVDLYIVAGRR